MKCFPCCKKKNSQFANATPLSLCLSAATHSFILFSFFPYAGYMSVNLINNNNNNNNNNGDDYDNDENNNNNATIITVDNVGIYAGLLGSVFTLGRFIGFIPWKLVRNSFGGKYTLMLSLFLTGIASIWVGMAQSYTSVVIARFIQGISNCISGCVKRAAINAQHNYDTKSKQYSKLISTISTSSESDEKEEEEEEIGSGGNAQALILSIMWWGTAL
jgi:MFS family permease